MKTKFYIQYSGTQISEDKIIKTFKEEWLKDNKKIKDIKSLEVYFKTENSTAYFVINGKEKLEITF